MQIVAPISRDRVFSRLEDMADQLKKSWPETFEKMMRDVPESKRKFFVYTTTKWDYRGESPKYNVYHQVRDSMPDAFWGTTLRKIDRDSGTVELIWTLPHKDTIDNFNSKDKAFADPEIKRFIDMKKSGELDRLMEEYNNNFKG